MQTLVRLWKRPSRDGKRFVYVLDFKDEQGKRRLISLGHADSRKAERQRAQKERELRMGIVEPCSMKLSEFLEDSVMRTRGQVSEGTLVQYQIAMQHLIDMVGDIDYQRVTYRTGEMFVQKNLDAKRAPATVNKELRSVKRLFQLAVNRGQLEENPLRRVPLPRVPRQKVQAYAKADCLRLLRAAMDLRSTYPLRWDLLILTALVTGMRRGELLNLTWQDVDFERMTVEVSPKKDTAYTWAWNIKDTHRRTLALTEELITLLADHQAKQPSGNPYIFIPWERYRHIQNRRESGTWTMRHGVCPVNNFTRHFQVVRDRAGLDRGEFHDLRRTCLTEWLSRGLSEHDVMTLAGHAEFETTRHFYLAVRDDLLDRARSSSSSVLGSEIVARLLRAVPQGAHEKGRPI